jgi:protein-disulfide isomerase
VATFLLTLVAVLGNGVPADKPVVEGNPSSGVRVLIYEDLQCSDCAVFRKMLDQQLLPKYGSKVAFEHRDFPLAKHKWARQGAVASRYFQEAGANLAIAWRRALMENIKSIQPEQFNDFLRGFAAKNGLDPERAVAALQDARLQAAVQADLEEGVARGIARTPTALVNGAPFIETIPVEEISKGIDQALKENGVQ